MYLVCDWIKRRCRYSVLSLICNIHKDTLLFDENLTTYNKLINEKTLSPSFSGTLTFQKERFINNLWLCLACLFCMIYYSTLPILLCFFSVYES